MIRRDRAAVFRYIVALGRIALFLGFLQQAQSASSVKLAWNASAGSDIAGYRVHYGISSGSYSQILDVGDTTTATVSNLADGQPYYFVVTAYNVVGLESVPSNQVTFTTGSSISGPSHFFGPGSETTLWRNNLTGDLYMWSMQGGVLTGYFVANVPLVWRVVGIGDFNGDGYSDILWENNWNYELVIWVMQGPAIVQTYVLQYGLPVVAVRSFSNNGLSDILLRDYTNGQLYLLANQGGGRFMEQPVGPAVSLDWGIFGAADVYGDGGSELFWANGASGQLVVWRLRGATVLWGELIGNLSPSWYIAGLGDFNEDGKDDILLRNSQSGQILAWIMSGLAIEDVWFPGTPSLDWQIAGIVNLSSSIGRDILLMHQQSGDVYLWSCGTSYLNETFIGSIDPSWMVAPN